MILLRVHIVKSFAVGCLDVCKCLEADSGIFKVSVLKTLKLVCLEPLVVGRGALESVSAKRSDVPFL